MAEPGDVTHNADWRELVDLDRLAAWMDDQGHAPGPLGDLRLLGGGTQNILLQFERGGRRFVLRRPPRHPRADGSSTMRREAQVLGALAATDVPHPRLISACADDSVLGAAFYLMEPVDGFNATLGLPALHAGDPAIRRAMGLALADGAARLGAVDHVAAGLAGLGRPEGFLERQVARWQAQLDSYAEYPGWAGPAAIPGIDAVARWLEANRPATFVPGILHGDYHIANVMYRHDGPELAAIVDWELTTIGDPLLDLGWLIATWPDVDGESMIGGAAVEHWRDFPAARDLVACYRERSQRDLAAIDWYGVLACYKLGIILEGSHARAAAGLAPVAIGDRLHASTMALFRRALAMIAAA